MNDLVIGLLLVIAGLALMKLWRRLAPADRQPRLTVMQVTEETIERGRERMLVAADGKRPPPAA